MGTAYKDHLLLPGAGCSAWGLNEEERAMPSERPGCRPQTPAGPRSTPLDPSPHWLPSPNTPWDRKSCVTSLAWGGVWGAGVPPPPAGQPAST